ncbi:MAG: DUF3300 domain-containing protein [Pseudomonadota bacterium]|nr:DUF3300 domain-containing protein [Pseudomonadota bacterium]
MARILRWVLLVAAAIFASAAVAQSGPEYEQRRSRAIFAQPELDQMLAPIALYPDALLSQILMAATYPQEVAEAAGWSRANGGLRGDQAVRAVEQEDWDPSVVSLVAFPQVLAMLDERRGWTERLGAAFLDQPDQVMDTVQHLRRRADAAGSLRSSEEIVVQRQGHDYVIDPPSPEVVYVPYYDPRVVYGNWWWPEYQPVYWNPWPGYGYRSGYRGFGWGYGISLGSGFFFGSFDWPRRYLRYSSHRPWYHHGHGYHGGHRWTHGRDHRRDRDGRSTSGRTGDRDRWRDRDGRPDRRDARTPDRRDGRTGDRRATAPAPAPTTQGFFPPRTETPVRQRVESIVPQQAASQNPALRTVTPRYRNESAPREGRIQAPAVQQQSAQPQAYVPAQRAALQRQAPAPVDRPAVQAAPVERSSPVQRAAPVERATREDRPERASPAERSSPAERGGGRAGRER